MKGLLKTLGIFVFFAQLWLPVGAWAGVSGQDAKVLERLEELSAGIETIASDFTQEKYLAVFQEAMLSSGRFYFKSPGSLRWELTQPVVTGFVLKGNEGHRWHQRTGRSESFDIDREPVMKIVAEQLLACAGADFDWLRQKYKIVVEAQAPVRLRLDPLFETAGFLNYLNIQFSSGGRYVQMVEVHEADGDYTRLRFENVVINQPLAEELF